MNYNGVSSPLFWEFVRKSNENKKMQSEIEVIDMLPPWIRILKILESFCSIACKDFGWLCPHYSTKTMLRACFVFEILKLQILICFRSNGTTCMNGITIFSLSLFNLSVRCLRSVSFDTLFLSVDSQKQVLMFPQVLPQYVMVLTINEVAKVIWNARGPNLKDIFSHGITNMFMK